jgi:hypothetical protein
MVLAMTMAAGCGGAATTPGPDGGGGGGDGGGPVTLASGVFPGPLALTSGCVVVAVMGSLTCVPRQGGAARTVATMPHRIVARMVADGETVIVTSLAETFGPDGDRVMRIDRVAIGDGSVTALGTAYAGYGAGSLALAAQDVVFSTGGSASLGAVPRAGGAGRELASDSGNFGDVAVVGNTAYWLNTGIYRHEITAPETFTNPIVPGGLGTTANAHLVSDGTTLLELGAALTGPEATLLAPLVPVAGPTIALRGTLRSVAAAGGRAVVATSAEVVDVDLVTLAHTTVAIGEQAVTVATDGHTVVWVTQAGELRSVTR